MPYNRYQSIQGYDPSPQEADWLGGMAYNPYSSGTDFGFALRNTLNNLLAHKQAQSQANKEQQRYDEEQARLARKEEFERRRLAVLERPEKLPEFDTKVQNLVKANPTMTIPQAMNVALGHKTPEELAAEKAESRKEFVERANISADIGVAHRVPKDISWQIGQRHISLMSSVSLDNTRKLDNLNKQLIAVDKTMNTREVPYVDFDRITGEPQTPKGRQLARLKSDLTDKIGDLENSNYELEQLKIQLASGTPLNDDQLTRLYSIVRGEKKKPELNLIDVITGVGKALFGGENVPR